MKKIKQFSSFLILTCHILIATAYSQTNWRAYWTGAADSDWHNPANWDPAVVPSLNIQIIIENDSLTPPLHWPILTQDIQATTNDIYLYAGAKFYFNGFTLYCKRLQVYESEIFAGVGGRIVFSRVSSAVVLAVQYSKMHGKFNIETDGADRSWIHNSISDDLNILAKTQSGMYMGDMLINGNVTYSKPFSPGNSNFAIFQPILVMNNCTISGDFLYNNQFGGRVAIDSGVLVNGKIDFEHIGQNPNPPQISQDFIFKGVSNNTPGGKIKVTGCNLGRIVGDTLRVDSLIIRPANGNVFIDSSLVYGHVAVENRVVHILGVRDSRIANSTFYGDLHWADTLYNIQETMGSSVSATPVSAPNTYYGNAHFKGKVHLGIMDTSTFHGNLTIEAMDGSVFHRARFAGDSPATLNTNNSTFPFKCLGINKTAAGSLTLQSPVYISDTLALHNGKVYTPGSYVRLQQGAITEHGGAQSYVAGQVQKEGNTPFVFPVGSDVAYKPFSISAPANTDDIISVQYHATSVTTVSDTAQRAAGVETISNCEYWEVEQPQGNSTITASLMWDELCMDTAVYIANTTHAQIAQWDGSMWSNAGNDGYANGYIATSGAVIPNGLFTFAAPKKVIISPEPPVTIPPMVVYPNPAQQHINVYATPGFKQGIIIDAIGRHISVHQIQPGHNTLDVSRLPAGVYFLKLITQTKQQVFKWVKL